MTADLVAFLRARLDEDEQVARGTSGREWWEHPTNWVSTPPLNRVGLVVHDGDRSHILRHDPARVLAEVEMKRGLIQWWEKPETSAGLPDYFNRYTSGVQQSLLIQVLRHLALPYAGHPDYREEWRP